MEGTQQLRNNWDYATTPSPESVLLTGLQPIGDAVSAYNQRSFEAGQANIAATRAAQLEQLKLTAAFKNVQARDAANQAWHAGHDSELLKQYLGVQQMKNDALGLSDSLKFAQAHGYPVLPQKQGETTADYTARQNASNNSSHESWKKSSVPFIKQQMLGLGQVRDSVNGIKQTVNQQADSAVMGLLPGFVGQQDPNDPGVAAYNKAIKQGAAPLDALRASVSVSQNLAASWNQYAQGQKGLIADKIMDQKGYGKDLDYYTLQAKEYAGNLSQFFKAHPEDAPDIATQASQSLVDDQYARAKVDKDARDSARAGGKTDPQTQAKLDQQAAISQAAASKIAQAHQQLKVSLGSSMLGGGPAGGTKPTATFPALNKEDALLSLGLRLDQNNQLQMDPEMGPRMNPTWVQNSDGATVPDPNSFNLPLANEIIKSPTLAWKTARPGLPGIQPGQSSPAAVLRPPVVPVAPSNAAAPTNALSMPLTVNDLYQMGVAQQPSALSVPAATAQPAQPENTLAFPQILDAINGSTTGQDYQNNMAANQFLMQ